MSKANLGLVRTRQNQGRWYNLSYFNFHSFTDIPKCLISSLECSISISFRFRPCSGVNPRHKGSCTVFGMFVGRPTDYVAYISQALARETWARMDGSQNPDGRTQSIQSCTEGGLRVSTTCSPSAGALAWPEAFPMSSSWTENIWKLPGLLGWKWPQSLIGWVKCCLCHEASDMILSFLWLPRFVGVPANCSSSTKSIKKKNRLTYVKKQHCRLHTSWEPCSSHVWSMPSL